MDFQPFDTLKRSETDAKFGALAKQALHLLGSDDYTIHGNPSGPGNSSFEIADTYRVRMSGSNFPIEKWSGLVESLEALRERDVIVHLCMIQTRNGFVILWLSHDFQTPVGIMIANLRPTEESKV
jgi:hypothetical protein